MEKRKHSEDYYEELLMNLMSATFHHTDKTAKPIVDKFIENHPEILDRYNKKFLYKV